MNLLASILYSRVLKVLICFTTLIRTTTQITLLLAAIVLVACGGGGGGGGAGAAASNPDDDADPGVASTDSPTSPKIVEASSADTTTASLSWLTSTDNQTPSDQINYHIYLSAEKGFDMSGDTPHQTLQGVGSTILSSLTADTRYFAKIAAVDGDGNRSISNEMEFKTSDVPAQRTTLDVNDSDAATIEESQITYENPAQDVEVGQVVVGEITKEDGSINGGFLRKVTDVSTVNGQTVATTEPTTLPEVFEKFAFTTSGVITAPTSTKPNANSNTTKSFRVNKSNKVDVTTRKNWEQTRFTIIDESIAETKKPKKSNWFKPLNVQLNDEDNVVVNDNLQIKGARSVVLNPDDALRLHLVAELIGDLNNTITISSFEVKDFDNSEITSTQPDYGAQFTNDVVEEPDGRVFRNKINFYWVPKSRHVTEEPYVLTVKAKEDKDRGFDDTLTYKVYIYVTNGSTEEIGKEEKTLINTNDDGNLTFESNMEVGFEPVLKAEGNFGITGLKTASVIASGKLTLNQDIVIKSLASAELKEESKKFINRKFIKIVVAGGVPIIISGELTVHAELEASAEAKLEINHDFDASYEIEIGVDYDASRTGDRWLPYKKSMPIYRYALKGEADAKVTGEVRLVPQLTIKIYEAAYGKLKVEPYLNATAALEGYFKYTQIYTPTTDFNISWDADYRFTELNLKGGVDIKIRMGLDLFSKEGEDLIGYPSRDQNDFKVFKPIDNKPIFALSKIEAIEEESVTNLADSRVIKLSTPSITDVPHPLTGLSSFGDKPRESLNPFDHNSIHWSSQGAGTEITHLSDNKKEVHLFYTKPTATPFSVKISGNSSLNKFIRQYETLDIDLTDSDLNGIPEYWENTYRDTDDDELDYRAEFQHGTFPDKNDSDNDGMPDGWEVRYGLKPLKNDAIVDIDHDGKTNLEEYQQSTDPTKLPIPIIYRVVEGDTEVELSWLQVAGASVYKVYQDGTEIDQTVLTSYTVTKLTNYTKYTFTVSAYNAFADSVVSNPIVATPQKETVVPSTPTGLSAEVGDKQISLSWNVVINAADYRVYQNGTLIETVTDTSHTVTGLTNGTEYSFQVMARNSAGESGLSSAISATPKKSIVILQPPKGLSAEAGDKQVSLSWNRVNGANEYEIYQDGNTLVTTAQTRYTVTGLANGAEYSFQVSAKNTSGSSTLSSAVTATPTVSPQVTNVSPKQVVLDQLTEFTIKGTNLPSTLAFYIPYCQNMSQIGYSSSLATFSCTPSSSTTDDGIVGLGNQTYLVKDAPSGMTLDTGVITVSAEPEEETPEIEITSINPTTVLLNEEATFTISGTNMPDTTVMFIPDCTSEENQLTVGTSTSRTYTCTPSGTVGNKTYEIKKMSKGELLATGTVVVTQAQINVSASELSVDGYEETNSVTLDTDSATNWTVAESSDWITVTPASGTGDVTLSIVTSTSSVATERQGSITVTAGSVSETISITQAARAIVNNVTPLSVEEGSSTTFTVTGSGLTSDFVVHIDDITISNITTNAAGTELTFLGTANQQTGQKNGVIKRYSAPAVNCAENVDHAACPLQATFYVGIEAIANQAPSAPSFSAIADGVAQRVVLVNYQSGADRDGTKVKTRCTATDSNRTEGAPYESAWVANGATDKASFIFQRGGDKTISCTTYDEQNASSETATASISIREIEQEPILASGFSLSGTAFNAGQQMTLSWELDNQTTFALFLQTESGSDVNVTGIYPNACSGSSYIGTGGCVAYQTTSTPTYNFTVSGELKGGSYKFALKTWRSGETQSELVYSKPFTVINDNPAPTAPQLLEPLIGASSVARPYIFKWKNSVDSDREQIFYSIHLSTDRTFPYGSATTVISGIKQSNTSSTEYAIPQRLSSSTKYYWKVSATDGNTHTESSYRYFTTAYETPVTSKNLITPNGMADVVNVDPIYISTSPFASTKGLSKKTTGSDVEVEFEGGCRFYNKGTHKIKFLLKKNNSRFYSKLDEACDGSWSQWVGLNAGKNEYYISSRCVSSTSAGNCTSGTWTSSESAKRSIYLIKKPRELWVDGYEDRISIRIRDIDLYGCGSDNPDCGKYFRIWRATENTPYGERWSRVTSWRQYDGDITIDDQRLDEDSNLDNVDRGFDLYTGETFYYFMEIAPDSSSKYASEFSNGAKGKLRPRSPTLPEIYSDIPAVIYTGQEITLNFKRGRAYESDKVQIGCYAYGGSANYTSSNIYRSSFADDYDVEPITFKFYNTSVRSIKCYSKDDAGNSSEVITFPVNIEGINSPTNVRVAIDDTNLVTLSWRDNSDYDYRIYRTTSKSCDLLNNPAACNDLLVDIATSSPWQDDTVGQETTYYYWVESIQGNYYALSQSSASVTTALVIPPSQITGLSAVEEIEQLDINWDANLDAQSYNLYWHTSADIGVTSGNYTGKVNTDEITHTLTDLLGGITYYLIVTGENDVGEGPSSNVFIATPTRAPLATGLTVDAYQQVNNVDIKTGASTSWQVIDSSDWITVPPQSGTGIGSLSVTTATSPYADERGGTITIFADGISEDIQVTQAARPIINSLTPLSVEVGSTTTFTATGRGLSSSFLAHIDDIAISNVSANAAGTELTFTGVANQQIGQKNGVIKRHSSAVNCAVEVDHVSCPLKAFFTVGITLQVPIDLQATSGDQKVTLRWSQAGSSVSYRVHQANESFADIDVVSNYSVLDGYSFYDTSETAMKVTGLTNYNTYRFVVTAIDGNEESLASNQVTAMPGPLLLGFGRTQSISHHPDPETKQFVAGTTAGVFLFSYADDGVITKERALIGHTSSVHSVAYSPDGNRIVSGSSDRTIRIWDANTGTQIGNALTGSTSFVSSVAYSPDGNRIISGNWDDTIRIWDANTGVQIGDVLTGHTSNVTSVAYSPDGNRIISGSGDKTIRMWDANTGAQIGNALIGHTDYVKSVAYSPDGNRIISGSSDRTIRIWDANTGAQIGNALTGHTDRVDSVTYSPDGNRIISGSGDKTIRIWDANTGAQIGDVLNGHISRVSSVTYSPNGSRIVSASLFEIRIWNVSTETEIGHILTGHGDQVHSTAYSPDGNRIISGSGDKTIRIWDADTGMQIKTISGHTSRISSLSYSPDGNRIISGGWDNTFRIWDANTGTQIGDALTGHADGVNSVAYSPDGNRIITDGSDETIRIWDANTGAQIGNALTGHTSWIYSVAYSPDGNRIISGSNDETIRIWDANTGTQIGNSLTGHTDRVYSVAYSPDGNRIISGSGDKTIRIWDASTGLQIGNSMTGHAGPVYSVVYSPDGNRIISGSWDATIRIWDASTGLQIGNSITDHASSVHSVAHSPDGNRIVSGSYDGSVRIWDISQFDPIPDPKPIVELIPIDGDDGGADIIR